MALTDGADPLAAADAMRRAMVTNFGDSGVMTVLLLFMYRVLHLSTVAVGALFAVGSLAAIVAATVAPRISAWLGLGPRSRCPSPWPASAGCSRHWASSYRQ